MKVLIYNKNTSDISNLKTIVNSLSLDIKFDETSSCDEVLNFYNNNIYEMVIIDFTYSKAETVVKNIIKQKPQQKIILLNDNFECLDNKDCNTCQWCYNIATVIKPLNQFQVGSLFNGHFECESKHKTQDEFNLEKIIKQIMFKYPFINFNKQKALFDLSLVVNPLKSTILIELISLLEVHSIEHCLMEDNLQIIKSS